jgi:hypothetical protein
MGKRKMIGLAVVMIAIVAFAVTALATHGTVAAAQEPDDPPDVPELDQEDGVLPGLGFGMRGGFHGFGHGFRGGEARQEALADALGISVDELEEAQQQARETMIEEAVANGLLSQEQADLMLSLDALKSYVDQQALLAEALGISSEELQAALEDGTTMTELMEELGLDAATVRENLVAAHEQALEEAVADGIISQELADQILESPRFGFGLGGPRGFHNFGGRGGDHGFGLGGVRGFGTFQNGANQSVSTESI